MRTEEKNQEKGRKSVLERKEENTRHQGITCFFKRRKQRHEGKENGRRKKNEEDEKEIKNRNNEEKVYRKERKKENTKHKRITCFFMMWRQINKEKENEKKIETA